MHLCYCSPCRLYGPAYRSFPYIPLEEVMWQPGEEVIQINLLRRLSEVMLILNF